MLRSIKHKIIRRLAEALTADAAAQRPPVNAVVQPGAQILPDAVIENLSGAKNLIAIGENSYVRGHLKVHPQGGAIRIGSWSYVGVRSEIWSMSSITIGDRVLISHDVNIIDNSGHSKEAAERHEHFRKIISTGHPKTWLELPGVSAAPVIIEDDVWINCGVIILQGVRIGARSVIAAGSIVTKDVPADVLYRCVINPSQTPIVRKIEEHITDEPRLALQG